MQSRKIRRKSDPEHKEEKKVRTRVEKRGKIRVNPGFS